MPGGEFGIGLGEKPAKVFAGAGNAAFHGAHPNSEDIGDLLVGVLQEIAQREDFTLSDTESPHAQRDVREELAVRRLARRIGDVACNEVRQARLPLAAGRAIKRVGLVAVPPEKIPIAVAREIEGYPVQPGGERSVAPETGEAAVRADKRVLGDLLGVGPVL